MERDGTDMWHEGVNNEMDESPRRGEADKSPRSE